MIEITMKLPGLISAVKLISSEQNAWYVSTYAQEVEEWASNNNRSFKVGETLSFGFWVAKIVSRGDELWFDERCPDTGIFHPGLTFCSTAMRHQKTYCEYYSLPFDPISAGQDAAVHPSVLSGSECRGWRQSGGEGFSGWYFTAQHIQNFAGCKRVKIHELIRKRPDLIKVMGLPEGAGILSPTVSFDAG